MKLLHCFCLTLILGITFTTYGQVSQPDSAYILKYKPQLTQLVSFLEFTLNTLGSGQTPAREKEIIIQNSYSKLFLNEKVQIEDDLAGSRSTMTNKEVQAYFKDVDFFFKDASFQLIIENIEWKRNEDGKEFFIISLSRHLIAQTYDGKKLENFQERFVEVNLDESSESLKIASIYTHAYSFREEMYNWWNNLSFDWKRFFAPRLLIQPDLSMLEALQNNFRLEIGDTLFLNPEDTGVPIEKTQLLADLQGIINIRELDISDNPSITDLDPLAKLTELRSLNISGTTITDLVPIRNLTKLETLICNNTLVKDLSPLKYVTQLRELYCDQSRVSDISVLKHLTQLEKLSLSQTAVSDLQPLDGLSSLRELNLPQTGVLNLTGLSGSERLEILNLEETKVLDLTPLRGCKKLQILNINRTPVTDLGPLSQAQELTHLYADQSRIVSLKPLLQLKSLIKVYCEHSLVSGSEAKSFMQDRPEVLIVFESQSLQQWWSTLSPPWQKVFLDTLELNTQPSRDDLQRLSTIQRLSIRGKKEIISLEPVEILGGLRFLDCSNTGIDSLGPLQDLVKLEELHFDSTFVNNLHPIRFLTQIHTLSCQASPVSSLEDLGRFSSLKNLNISSTRVRDLAPLQTVDKLKILKAEQSLISDKSVIELLHANPDCLVLYKSGKLRDWWKGLSPDWQVVFRKQLNVSGIPSDAELHRIIQLKAISFSGQSNIHSLNELDQILELKELSFTNSRIDDLWFLRNHKSLEKLDCSNNPIPSLEPLAVLTNLKYLNCENTPIEDLEPLQTLLNLETLICSGTQIKDLKPLSVLQSITTLDCSNTDIHNLKPIRSLYRLKLLKCYNTRLKEKAVAQFKESVPDLEVVYY